jgi:hypothetical protein
LARIGPLKDRLTNALNAIVSQDKISEAYHVFQSLKS